MCTSNGQTPPMQASFALKSDDSLVRKTKTALPARLPHIAPTIFHSCHDDSYTVNKREQWGNPITSPLWIVVLQHSGLIVEAPIKCNWQWQILEVWKGASTGGRSQIEGSLPLLDYVFLFLLVVVEKRVWWVVSAHHDFHGVLIGKINTILIHIPFDILVCVC